eukprot:c25236_g1_i1 orf=1890-3506(+)
MALLKREDLQRHIGLRSHPAVLFEEHMKVWAQTIMDQRKKSSHLHSLHRTWLEKQKPLDRTMQFWSRSVSVYASYKVCQVRTSFLSKEAQERAWEVQHEWAAEKVYSLCSELGGFFLKVAQLIGKPDLAPDAWVRKLVTLCDTAPATPFSTVTGVLEQEFGVPTSVLFEEFHKEPLGSASVAQVHQAKIRGLKDYVAVKVQHPGVQELMMTDIRNLKAFAAFVRRFDVKFDMLSVLDELEEQVGLEFDFIREARSMDRIANSLSITNGRNPPVVVPRSIPGLVTRKVLIMEFIDGLPLLRLGEEMAKRGIDPSGAVAKFAQRRILKDLTAAYGQMILKDGFFQADPHPGNILITGKGKVALLDYGQVKDLPNSLRLDYAKFILALNSGEPSEIGRCLEKLGVVVCKKVDNDPASLKIMASMMFDTKLPPGLTKANPFNEDDVLRKFPVMSFPKEMFFVLRTVHILRGLSVFMGISYSCAEEWGEFAKQALSESNQGEAPHLPLEENCSSKLGLKKRHELVWEKRKRSKQLLWFKSSVT